MKNLLLHPTPIGTVGIVENGRAITDILFEEQLPGHAVRHTTLLLERAAKQLDEYFAGKRTSFDLPLEPEGTPYRKKVCIIGKTRCDEVQNQMRLLEG